MKKNITVFSIDFNSINYKKDKIEKVQYSNKDFFNHIEITNKEFEKSNQGLEKSYLMIEPNDYHENDLCLKIRKSLNNLNIKMKIDLDDFILADIFKGLDKGGSNKDTINSEMDTAIAHPNDVTGVALLYAQMHKIANAHPGDNIHFFYHMKTINNPNFIKLKNFYTNHKSLIPNNLTLNICDDNFKNLISLTGKNFTDKNYKETVQEIFVLTKPKSNPINNSKSKKGKQKTQNILLPNEIGSEKYYVADNLKPADLTKRQKLLINSTSELKPMQTTNENQDLLNGNPKQLQEPTDNHKDPLNNQSLNLPVENNPPVETTENVDENKDTAQNSSGEVKESEKSEVQPKTVVTVNNPSVETTVIVDENKATVPTTAEVKESEKSEVQPKTVVTVNNPPVETTENVDEHKATVPTTVEEVKESEKSEVQPKTVVTVNNPPVEVAENVDENKETVPTTVEEVKESEKSEVQTKTTVIVNNPPVETTGNVDENKDAVPPTVEVKESEKSEMQPNTTVTVDNPPVETTGNAEENKETVPTTVEEVKESENNEPQPNATGDNPPIEATVNVDGNEKPAAEGINLETSKETKPAEIVKIAPPSPIFNESELAAIKKFDAAMKMVQKEIDELKNKAQDLYILGLTEQEQSRAYHSYKKAAQEAESFYKALNTQFLTYNENKDKLAFRTASDQAFKDVLNSTELKKHPNHAKQILGYAGQAVLAILTAATAGLAYVAFSALKYAFTKPEHRYEFFFSFGKVNTNAIDKILELKKANDELLATSEEQFIPAPSPSPKS